MQPYISSIFGHDVLIMQVFLCGCWCLLCGLALVYGNRKSAAAGLRNTAVDGRRGTAGGLSRDGRSWWQESNGRS